MESFEFSFTPTRMDFANVMRASILREGSKRRLWLRIGFLSVPMILCTTVFLITSIGMSDLSCIMGIVALYVCGAVLVSMIIFLGPLLMWLFLDPHGRFHTQTNVTVDHDSIRTKTRDGEARSRWASVEYMVENRKYFIFPTSNTFGNIRIMAEVQFVPRRVFQSAEQEDKFRKYVSQKIRQWSGSG